jgi:GTP-binding protein
LYDSRLSARPWCIVANKMDLPDAAENLPALERRFAGVGVIPISAERGEGIEKLKLHLERWLFKDAPQPAAVITEGKEIAVAD